MATGKNPGTITAMRSSPMPIDVKRLKRLLQHIVDIYSPSGKEEELVDYLRGYLRRLGLPVTLQKVDENRHNVLVLPSGKDIKMAMIGHLDTVPAYELEEYGYSERDDIIKGLGVTDMKGGCAAMVEAYLSIWNAGYTNLPVALCLVVGEEEEGDGARELAKHHRLQWALIGEPTDLKPCLSHYGYIEIQISTEGARVHASLADATSNAVQVLLNVLLCISQHMQHKRPELGFNMRDLYSSQSGFTSPDHCEAWLDLHVPPSASMGEIITEVEEIVIQERGKNNAIDAQCRIVTITGGFELPEKGSLVTALKSVFKQRKLSWTPEAFKSHSDANQLWTAGVKTLLIGPGDIKYAHAPQETISFEQVVQAAEIYADIIYEYLIANTANENALRT